MAIWLLPVLVPGVAISCGKDDGGNEIENPGGEDNEPPTVNYLKDAPYPVGGALNISSLKNNETYRNTVLREYSTITAENAMKMGAISRGRGVYYWDDVRLPGEFCAIVREAPSWARAHLV
ncbi:MAG: endo-1,4-beta-xylanase [Breznakibacter sp.]